MTEKRKRILKVILGVLAGYILILFVGYYGVSYYFSDHFLKGTVINGIDCSNKTVSEVKKSIQDKIGSYKLRITEIDGKTETISAVELELQYVDDNKVDELLAEQDSWNWLTSFSQESSYELAATTTYDDKRLDEILDDMSCFQPENIHPPKDAYLEEKDGMFRIVPEDPGSTLDREKMKKEVASAIEQGKTEINLVELGCYQKPEVLKNDTDLVKEKNEKNKLMRADFIINFGDRQEKVNGSLIKNWIVKDSQKNWVLDKEKIDLYVKQLSQKYDTYGGNREFVTTGGKTVALSGGNYGWMIHKEGTAKELMQAVADGKKGIMEPIYLYKGKERETNDIGRTYIEVSISEQRLWFYKDGEILVDTPVITGNVLKGKETPAGGVWSVDRKETNVSPKGVEGGRTVKYWMQFNGNIGILEGDEVRTQYGGTLYKSEGTSGNIEMPAANAEKIYNSIDAGTPVIIY